MKSPERRQQDAQAKRRRYLAARELLYSRLGNRCAKYNGIDDQLEHHEELHIDHRDGRTWEVRKVGSYARVMRYLKELDEGVRLQILCRSCNGYDGQRRGHRRRKTKKE